MKRMKKKFWLVLLIVLCVATAAVEYGSIHNPYARAVTIIATCLLLGIYYFLLKAISNLDAENYNESWIMRQCLGPGLLHGIIIAGLVGLAALLTSTLPNTSINWPGIGLTAAVIVIAILIGSAIGIHRGAHDSP